MINIYIYYMDLNIIIIYIFIKDNIFMTCGVFVWG